MPRTHGRKGEALKHPTDEIARRRHRDRAVSAAGAVLLVVALAQLFYLWRIAAPSDVLNGDVGMIARVAFAFVLLYVALITIESRKVTVLYLRRFGLQCSTQTLTEALEQGVGRRVRIFTLDDRLFVPLEVPRLERAVSRFFAPAVGTMMVLYFVRVSGTTALPGGGLAIAIVSSAVAAIWLLSAVFLFVLLHRRRVRRRSRLLARNDCEIQSCEATLYGLGRRILSSSLIAPQATTIAVSDGLWRDAVASFAARVDAILIDVTEPSENVLWEINTVDSLRKKDVCVLVEADRQFAPPANPDLAQDLSAQLRRQIGGRPILAYGPSDDGSPAAASFVAALERALREVGERVDRRSLAPPNGSARVRNAVLALAYYAAILVVSIVVPFPVLIVMLR